MKTYKSICINLAMKNLLASCEGGAVGGAWGGCRATRASGEHQRAGGFSKKGRAKDTISPQKETSESERWEEARAFGAGVGKRARRFATNWDGTGAAKWADLSLFHI